ncbi:hypothetical protein PN584_17440, partial [Parabacteroides merdae]|nr:hypothetical protein [Parabacteroides merdae]
MAKKENGNATKSFILRVDAEMMEAIEAWAADEFRSTMHPVRQGKESDSRYFTTGGRKRDDPD